MVVITIVMMEVEQIKKVLKYIEENKAKLLRLINIAMIVIITIIAIILINIIYKKQNMENRLRLQNVNSTQNIKFIESEDEEINKFIYDYFRARNTLNYPKIFSSYGRDYYKERREDKKGVVDDIVDHIRYEKTFIKNYDNIEIYTTTGMNEGDVVCVVTYDLMFGFTDEVAPTMMFFYLTKDDESYIIKDNLDVGTSKYLMECANAEEIKNMYSDIKTRLRRALESSSDFKLAYNSLRQYEMNMDGDINYEKNKLIDNYGIIKLDPIEDADDIYYYIIEARNEDKMKKELDEYLDRVSPHGSDATTSTTGN